MDTDGIQGLLSAVAARPSSTFRYTGGRGLAAGASLCLAAIVIAACTVPIRPSANVQAVFVLEGEQIDVAAPISGRIVQFFVEPGHRVQKGDALFLVARPTVQDGSEDSLIPTLESVHQQIEIAETALRRIPDRLHALDARLQQVSINRERSREEFRLATTAEEGRLRHAKTRRELLQRAVVSQLISEADYLTAAHEVLAIEASLADRRRQSLAVDAEFGEQLARLRAEKRDLEDKAEATKVTLAQLHGQLSEAVRAERQTISAPSDGYVASLSEPNGSYVEAGARVLWMATGNGELAAYALVPEKYLGSIERGSEARVRVHQSDSSTPAALKARVADVSHSLTRSESRWWLPVVPERAFLVTLELSYVPEELTEYLAAGRTAQASLSLKPKTVASYLIGGGT